MIRIDGYPIDLALSEQYSWDSEITEFPVEQGVNVSDHVRPKPLEMQLEGIVSNNPIGAIAKDPSRDLSSKPAKDAYQRLVDLRDESAIFTVETDLGKFENMVIQNLSIPRDVKNSKGLQFTVTLRQINFVVNTRTTVPIAKRGLGLGATQIRDGNKILWRKGKPPGSSNIVGQETVTLKGAGGGSNAAIGDRSEKSKYVRANGEDMLPIEEQAFKKDLARDTALVADRDLKEQLRRKAAADKAANDRYFKIGQAIDPAVFGLKR